MRLGSLPSVWSMVPSVSGLETTVSARSSGSGSMKGAAVYVDDADLLPRRSGFFFIFWQI